MNDVIAKKILEEMKALNKTMKALYLDIHRSNLKHQPTLDEIVENIPSFMEANIVGEKDEWTRSHRYFKDGNSKT